MWRCAAYDWQAGTTHGEFGGNNKATPGGTPGGLRSDPDARPAFQRGRTPLPPGCAVVVGRHRYKSLMAVTSINDAGMTLLTGQEVQAEQLLGRHPSSSRS